MALTVGKILLGLCLVALTRGQGENIQAIECPVPGADGDVPQELCAQYSACTWSEESQVCHMQDNDVAGYSYTSGYADHELGYMIPIQKNDPTATMFEGDIVDLNLDVSYYEDYHVRIRIYDPANARYEVPLPLNLPTESAANPLADVTVGQDGENVVLNVTRRSNGAELFRTIGPITFEDQFIQFSVRLSSPYVYGFGENPHDTLQLNFSPRTTYPMFARDQPTGRGETNHYGTYPYYVNIEDDEGNTHSVLFYNSNAMEYTLFELPDGSPALTLRSIGGIIDIHVFAGPTPEDVNQQYATLVGDPMFPPYWALGFQLSRYGYDSTAKVREVRDRMRAAGIPQDVQTFDIDYMDERRDFTYDPVNFADLPELVEEFHAENIRTVLILDPAVVASVDYEPYARGRDSDAFIGWVSPDLVPSDQPADADDYMVGYVWPSEKTVFPDFFNPATKAWWANEIALFRQQINFDALWIDMNEPANFGTNLEQPWNWPEGQDPWSLKCPFNSLDSPPYPTKAATQSGSESQRLSDKTICMSGSQTDGTNSFTHYDVHNLFGYSESVATYEALESLDEGVRPFVLSRSTFPGSGHYAIHWLGDNSATWDQLRDSVIGMIEFNLFGIPMVGADICGFLGEPTEELCARWMQLGAFYPFSRNHNTEGTADQDPAVWPQVAEISRDVLLLRYKYLPYLYSLFHNAHMGGSTVVRPLFNVFPSDVSVRNNADQFFWGDAIMVAPVLDEGAVTKDVYFPEGMWYDIENGLLAATGPASLTVDAPLDKIPVYVRSGKILPFQEPAVTTDESRLNDFGLLVALDDNQYASGEVYWDDGEMEHMMSETYLSDVLFSQDQMVMLQKFNAAAAEGINLATIRCLGFPAQPDEISVNGAVIDTYVYDATTQILDVTVNLPLMDDFNILFNYQNP